MNLILKTVPIIASYKEANMGFGQRLRSLRHQRKLSLDQASEKLKMHKAQLANYETGRTKPAMDCLIRLSSFYDVSIDYLIFGYGNELSKRSRIHDTELLEIFQQVDHLKKGDRDQIKWTLEALVEKNSMTTKESTQ